jgi:hypothetical protein
LVIETSLHDDGRSENIKLSFMDPRKSAATTLRDADPICRASYTNYLMGGGDVTYQELCHPTKSTFTMWDSNQRTVDYALNNLRITQLSEVCAHPVCQLWVKNYLFTFGTCSDTFEWTVCKLRLIVVQRIVYLEVAVKLF